MPEAQPLGVYLNLVEGLLWVQDVEGSNPFTPTVLLGRLSQPPSSREVNSRSSPSTPAGSPALALGSRRGRGALVASQHRVTLLVGFEAEDGWCLA